MARTKRTKATASEFDIDVAAIRTRRPRFSGGETDSCASTCDPNECTDSCASGCNTTDTCETCGSCTSEHVESTGGPCVELIVSTRDIVERASHVIAELSSAIERTARMRHRQAVKTAERAVQTAQRTPPKGTGSSR